jgi:hypothetical protein
LTFAPVITLAHVITLAFDLSILIALSLRKTWARALKGPLEIALARPYQS